MVMLFANLKTSLKEGIKPAYTLFGTDIFLVNKAIELIFEAAKVEPLNVIRLDDGASESEIDAALRNVSMFWGKNAVVVRGETESRVILDKGTTQRVECNPMTADLVTRLIVNQSEKKITHDAAMLLAQCCDNNYARVDNEINKLLNYYKDKPLIERSDVEEFVTKTDSYQIYELSNVLLKKDLVKAENVLQSLTLSGVDDYAIFGNLSASVRRLFYSLTSGVPDAQLAAFLKVHPYAVTASRRDGKHLKDRISKIHSEALELEYQIKSGKILAGRAVSVLMGLFVS